MRIIYTHGLNKVFALKFQDGCRYTDSGKKTPKQYNKREFGIITII